MSKKIKYAGNGTLEFYPISNSGLIKLVHGQEVLVEFATEKDIELFKQLRSTGLLYIQTEDKIKEPVADEVPVEPVEVPAQDEVPVEPVVDEGLSGSNKDSVEDQAPEELNEKNLMAHTAAELKEIADNLGVKYADGASKKEITTAILSR